MIIRQCDDRDDVSCAQILYRTMVFAGPASKAGLLEDDRHLDQASGGRIKQVV